MGYSSINAYDAVTRIPQFLGLYQYGDTDNGNPCYAKEARNLDTRGGVLMPMAAPATRTGVLTAPIETLMRVVNRWGSNAQPDILVAASGGSVYWWDDDSETWTVCTMPEGIEEFSDSRFSWVNYEINEYDDEGEAVTVDVILMSNATDGMFLLRGDDMTIEQIRTQYKFGIIERHAERIWGTAILGEPDLLVYSAPYDPTDWAARSPDITPEEETEWIKQGQPEDGAGVIKQPTWDGDSFTALKTFGDQLIAFKRARVWRIYGTNPGEYEIRGQYGGGAPAPYTIAVDRERIYMLDTHGVSAYDGNTVEPFQQDLAHDILLSMDLDGLDGACGCLWQQKYYLAFDQEGGGRALLTYDLHDNTWNYRTDINAISFLPCESALYYTSGDDPFRAWEYKENAWESGAEPTAAAGYWRTAWQTANVARMIKGPFRIYFRPEVKDEPVDLTITLATERGTKSKTIRVNPLLQYEENMAKEARTRCVPFAMMGRQFCIAISTERCSPVWRIAGGIEIEYDQETD